MAEIIAPSFWIFVLVMAGIYTIFALGLQLQYGVGGLMNFGHVAMMAISSYTMAILVIKLGYNLWIASLLGIAAAALGGAFLGLTTLRLRGDYFAIVSIAFSEIIRYIINNASGLTGGTQGSLAIAGAGQTASFTDSWDPIMTKISDWLYPIFGDAADRDFSMLLIVWAVAGLLIWLSSRIQKTGWARVLRATREDDYVPASLGKNVFRFRVSALIVGSIFAGIAGIFWALQFSILAADDFHPLTTFFAWTIIILGGASRVRGVSVGAIVFGFLYAGTRFFEFPPFTWFDSTQRAYLRLIIIGTVLIILMMRRPQGIFGKREEMVLE